MKLDIKLPTAQNKVMNYVKVFVSVNAVFNKSGGVLPKSILWADGNEYKIDKVVLRERAPCKSGGVLPFRYTVIMNGQVKYLYYERDVERWFVEKEY